MMVIQFYESASLDNDWIEIAKKEVDEPEGEEEMAGRLEELRSLITNRFEEPIDEDILSETNLKRFLRSSKWDPSSACVLFLASVQLVFDFPKYLLPLEKPGEVGAIQGLHRGLLFLHLRTLPVGVHRAKDSGWGSRHSGGFD